MTYSGTRFRILLLIASFTFFIAFCLYSASNKISVTNTKVENDVDSSLFRQQKITKDVCNTAIVIRNTDPNHTRAHIDFWKRLSDKTMDVYRKRWQRFITSVNEESSVPNFIGKGIVLVAGNRDTFQRALTTIKLLRHMHHCNLDIEVWHLSDEKPSALMINELTALGATARDLSYSNLPRPIEHRRDADKQ